MIKLECNHKTCKEMFNLTVPTRKYCSESCRDKAAKMRRYYADSDYYWAQLKRSKEQYIKIKNNK